MARCIDADKFRQELIDRQITTQFFNPRERHEIGCIIEMLDNAPTADVVPKSEVENVIDEFIKKVCDEYEIWTDSDEREYRYTFDLMEKAKAELKKKNTED